MAIEAYFDGYTGTKDPSEYEDPLSTGRKMAEKAAPIKVGMVCEWAWLAAAGGGIEPIIGCPGRPASDRHHGPDKNTLNNVVGVNLWRICDWCHNTWHARNDPYYGSRPTFKDEGGNDLIDNQGRPKVDASQPFLPLPEYADRYRDHDPHTRAPDAVVYEEDGRRREESRKHGNVRPSDE